MKKINIQYDVSIEETTSVTLVDVSKKYQLSKSDMQEWLDYGVIDEDLFSQKNIELNQSTLAYIEKICRLQHDLGVNLPGALLALDLLQNIESLQDELEVLRAHLGDR